MTLGFYLRAISLNGGVPADSGLTRDKPRVILRRDSPQVTLLFTLVTS